MSFAGILGQDKQVSILRRAMQKGRVPHALLFHGIDGIGKRTTALTFAKALNCAAGRLDACDRCDSCRKIENGNHPDVITVRPEGAFIKVEDIRDVQRQIMFRPFEGQRRVFIIIDADRMNAASANALLKTLEEPSPVNLLVLVTSRPYQLLPTILSRCQKLRFHPIPEQTIALVLEKRHGMTGEMAAVVAASSRGSIGRALEIRAEAYIDLRNAFIRKLADGAADPVQALLFAADFGKSREDVQLRFEILRNWYRDLLVYRETGQTGGLIHRDCLETLKPMAERMSSGAILESMDAIDRAAEALERNANKQLTLETMVFKLFR